MKNEEIFKLMDSNIKKNKKELIAYAQTRRGRNGKKYKYYTQFIFEEYKTRTADKTFKEIIGAGINPPSVNHIWNIKHKIQVDIDNKKPLKDGDKKCRTEGCKKKVPPPNHSYCKDCDRRHKSMSNYVDSSFHNELPCAY